MDISRPLRPLVFLCYGINIFLNNIDLCIVRLMVCGKIDGINIEVQFGSIVQIFDVYFVLPYSSAFLIFLCKKT